MHGFFWTYALDDDVAARAPDIVTRLALEAGCDRFTLCFGPPPKRRRAADVHGTAWTKQGDIIVFGGMCAEFTLVTKSFTKVSITFLAIPLQPLLNRSFGLNSAEEWRCMVEEILSCVLKFLFFHTRFRRKNA
jgi:hypothetical protein